MPLNENQQALTPPKPSRVVFKWLVVCVVAAAPSFYFGGCIGGWRTSEVLGMIVGILIFVVGYSLIEFMPQIQFAMSQRTKRRASRIAYITRMGISVLFPVGVFVDLYCGIVSLAFSAAIMGQDWAGLGRSTSASDPSIDRFLSFLLTTIIQGTILNVVVFAYMLIVYGFLRLIGVENLTSKTKDRDTGAKIDQRSD